AHHPLPRYARARRLPGAFHAQARRGDARDSSPDLPRGVRAAGVDDDICRTRRSRGRRRNAAARAGSLYELAWYSPAGMGRIEDRRDNDRIEILGELNGEVMVFQPMTIKEISPGGAQVETAFPLQLDSLHDFRLALGERFIVVKGRVAHCSI